VPEPAEPLSVTWLGHGTVLVEAAGVRLMTDPLLRPRVAHLRRVAPPPSPLLEALDAVLISHVHADHLDPPSLRRLPSRRFLVPRGAGRMLRRRGLGPVVELEEGDEVTVGGLTVRATHAEHAARRGLRSVPSLGYLVSGPARIYFAGDTDLFPGMSGLAPLDVALLPVAGWGPRLGPGHLDPLGAAEALRLLRPQLAIPIHWGTYVRIGLPRDPAALREPAQRFALLAAELAPEVAVQILEPGEQLARATMASP
jgi:L-ascorbate metabolism protein UlaG (beta-lactamase superfamily)